MPMRVAKLLKINLEKDSIFFQPSPVSYHQQAHNLRLTHKASLSNINAILLG
jgi:hypothetical protein